MPVINQVQTADAYADNAKGGVSAAIISQVYNSRGGWFSVSAAAVFCEMQYGPQGASYWTGEVLLGNGAFAYLDPKCIGVRFRSAVSGVPATVTAQISQGDEPPLSIVALGQLSVVGLSLTFQHNGAAAGSEPILDFDDTAGVLTWTLTDDVPGTRMRVSPSFTNPALFPGPVGIGGNAGDTQISRLAAGIVGATTAFSTGPTSEAVGGGGVAGLVMGTRYNAVATLATSFAEVSSITTDSQGRFARDMGGTMTWGAGGASARDATLARTAGGTMTWTLSQFNVDTSAGVSGATISTNGAGNALRVFTSGDANPRWGVNFAGGLSWGPGGATAVDTSLSRSSANTLDLGTSAQKGALRLFAGVTGDAELQIFTTTDTNARLAAFGSGTLVWGSGSAGGDVNLTRVVNSPTGTGSFLELTAGSGLGYGTGTGGAVTQLTSLSTGVTLNKPSGQITLFTTAWANGGVGNFVLTNSVIGVDDTVVLSFKATIGGARFLAMTTAVAAGSCTIGLWNLDALTASGAAVLNFAVIKGAVA